MKPILFLLTISLLVTSQLVNAETVPLKLASDHRIEVVNYSSNNVIPILGKTFTTTQIIFSKDEVIENIQNGDLAAWTVSVDKNLPYMFFIKPTVTNSNTNMTVVTNKHTYYFQLVVSNKSNQSTTYAIKFLYPNEQRKQIAAALALREQQRQAELSAFQNPKKYNWNYSFSGDRSIVPLHAFDDGKFTYLQLRNNQPVPAVFAVATSNGKESVVNYRQDHNYLIIQRIAPQFTLRLGKQQVASIFNNQLINKIKNNES